MCNYCTSTPPTFSCPCRVYFSDIDGYIDNYNKGGKYSLSVLWLTLYNHSLIIIFPSPVIQLPQKPVSIISLTKLIFSSCPEQTSSTWYYCGYSEAQQVTVKTTKIPWSVYSITAYNRLDNSSHAKIWVFITGPMKLQLSYHHNMYMHTQHVL